MVAGAAPESGRCTWSLAVTQGLATPMTPTATRPPALPSGCLEVVGLFVNDETAADDRVGPWKLRWESIEIDVALPFALAVMLPRSPTCRLEASRSRVHLVGRVEMATRRHAVLATRRRIRGCGTRDHRASGRRFRHGRASRHRSAVNVTRPSALLPLVGKRIATALLIGAALVCAFFSSWRATAGLRRPERAMQTREPTASSGRAFLDRHVISPLG